MANRVGKSVKSKTETTPASWTAVSSTSFSKVTKTAWYTTRIEYLNQLHIHLVNLHIESWLSGLGIIIPFKVNMLLIQLFNLLFVMNFLYSRSHKQIFNHELGLSNIRFKYYWAEWHFLYSSIITLFSRPLIKLTLFSVNINIPKLNLLTCCGPNYLLELQ